MNEPIPIKKNSITETAIQKQKRLLILAIVCVITLFIGSSYALLTNFDKTDNVVNFTTGNLNMTVNNTLINLEGKLPESDTNGLLNATPITLTLTNTGNLLIDGYEVKLVSDKNQTSTLDEKYIKYAISEDGTSYSEPSILIENSNIIFTGYDLEVDASKTIYLKVWIDETAGNNALDKTYYGSIEVELYQKKDKPSYEMMKSIAKAKQTGSCKTYVEEDGIIYISGTADCIDFNYVWYSGKLWRITAIYPDGTMKMITDSNITTINWGATSTISDTDLTSAYSTSYMREWLNQEFLPTLYNYENIIVEDAGWYSITDSASTPTKPTGDYTLTDPVGLLNAYEYYMAYKNASDSTNYLNIGYYWWLITPYSSSNVRRVHYKGNLGWSYTSSSLEGVRPVVNLKSAIHLSGGSGTQSDPYRIKDDIEDVESNTTLINARSSGEYVKLENDSTGSLYRIVNTEIIKNSETREEKLTTKIVLDDYVKDTQDTNADGNTTEVLTKYFSSSDSYVLWTEVDKTNTTYWRGYLNNTWLSEIDNTYNTETSTSSILEKGTYYLGKFSGSYKSTVCSTVSSDISIEDCIENGGVVSNTSSDDYVGLLRVGEMFASQTRDYTYSTTTSQWLITAEPTSIFGFVYDVRRYGSIGSDDPSSYSLCARPTINLKSTIIIKSGSGTKADPFVVGLPT